MIGMVSFDPILPLTLLAALVGLTVVVLVWAGLRGLVGTGLRALGAAVLLAALANPSLREEERDPLADVAFLVIDETGSNAIADRAAQTQAAEAALNARLSAFQEDPDAPLELRVVRVGDDAAEANGEPGSHLFTALERAAADVSPDRIAGALLVTDGQVHDAERGAGFPGPLHVLLTGAEDEWDRRLHVANAPAFGIVGETVMVTVRAEALGAVPAAEAGRVPLTISLDGEVRGRVSLTPGEDMSFEVEIARAGQNVLELELPNGAGELTTRNNTALVSINGVRDRLRVLLVSGEPHPGGRTWRNLLKADPAVDLVQFTILRPPTKQDGTPVNEMSLIAFPVRELFMEKIDEFDLIIFDRYRWRGVLPFPYLRNIGEYVRRGGAVLVASGPALAGVESLYRTPLRDVLPGAPTARVIEEGFLPRVTELGTRHPVTAELIAAAPGPVGADGAPGWGRWFRQVELDVLPGSTVMSGADEAPLLVLDRVEEGRIAMLASDHAWLWSRGFEGGGPQLEMLRRLSHWLMREPELEEEILTAEPDAGGLVIERRSLGQVTGEVEITSPDGLTETVQLTEVAPGRWRGRSEAPADGLYRLSDATLDRVVAVGPAAPREFANAISSGGPTDGVRAATGGGLDRLADGSPRIRRVREGSTAEGRGWIGLVERRAYRVENITLTPLAPGWLVLLLAALLSVAAWRRESR